MRAAALAALVAGSALGGGALGALATGGDGAAAGGAPTRGGGEASPAGGSAPALPAALVARVAALEDGATAAGREVAAMREQVAEAERTRADLAAHLARLERARAVRAGDPLARMAGAFAPFDSEAGGDEGGERGTTAAGVLAELGGIPEGPEGDARREELRRRLREAAAADEARRWDAARSGLALTAAQEESLKDAVRVHRERLRDAVTTREAAGGPAGGTVTIRVPDRERILEERRAFEERVREILDGKQARQWADDGWASRLGTGRVEPRPSGPGER